MYIHVSILGRGPAGSGGASIAGERSEGKCHWKCMYMYIHIYTYIICHGKMPLEIHWKVLMTVCDYF